MTPVDCLTFTTQTMLGRAFRIDTSSVWAEAVDHEKLTTVGVGSLIAFQSSNPSEYLIGMLDRVTRDFQEEQEPTEAIQEDSFTELRQRDLLKVFLLGTYRQVDGINTNTFKRGADSYPLVNSGCWVVEGKNLQILMGILSQQLPPERQLTVGRFVSDSSAKAIIDGDRLFQRHAALVGSTGSGKSSAVALILERAAQLDYPNIIVLDMHGEYAPLACSKGAIARRFKIAGPDNQSNTQQSLYLPWWLLNQEEMQTLLLDRTEANAPNQASRLSFHVRSLKEKFLKDNGFTDLESRFTVDSPIPYSLDSLISCLEDDDTRMVTGSNGREKQGPFYGKLTRFVSRFRAKVEDRRYSFMFDSSNGRADYDWLHKFASDLMVSDGNSIGIKIIDFSEVPSDILPIVAGVLARIIYDIQFWSPAELRAPISLVCDEAHIYLPNQPTDGESFRSLESFERIAKEGRKYGISLFIVSQRPSDVSHTILSQCNNFVVLRLTNRQDQTVIGHLIPDNMHGITDSLPLLDVGESLVLGDSLVLPSRIRLDRPKIEPTSATIDFWKEWNERKSEGANIIEGVEAMRRQTR